MREDGERARAQPVRVHHTGPLRLTRPRTEQPAQPQHRRHVPRLRPVAELHRRERHPVKRPEPERGIGGGGAEDGHAGPPAG